MNKKFVVSFSLFLITGLHSLHADDIQNPQPVDPITPLNEIPPPAVIESQLESAEREFSVAKKMFNPWYAGPLLTPSAHILPPGVFNFQPYVFYTSNSKRYDSHKKAQDIPDLKVLNPQAILQVGILDWLDAVVIGQYIQNKQNGQTGSGWGDTSLGLGFGLMTETPYRPAVLIGVRETFPSGEYQNLSSVKEGLDATGEGAYSTTLSFNISKIVWWVTTHPMNLRLSLNYTIPTDVDVKGFNAYGGGFGTNGHVHTPKNFAVDFGYEYSFTKKWVIACDIAYVYVSKTTFSGIVGADSFGHAATVGAPSNEQLSLAPALEYNPTENLGFLLGTWFSVYGRNSLDFVSGVATFTYTF